MSLGSLIFLSCNEVSIPFADLSDKLNLFLGPPPTARFSATARHTHFYYHSSWSNLRAGLVLSSLWTPVHVVSSLVELKS